MIIAKILSFAVAMWYTAIFLNNVMIVLCPREDVQIKILPTSLAPKLAALGWITFYALHLVWF